MSKLEKLTIRSTDDRSLSEKHITRLEAVYIMNERITEDIVRNHFKNDNLTNDIKMEEQKSDIPRIKELLKNASKRQGGGDRKTRIYHNVS